MWSMRGRSGSECSSVFDVGCSESEDEIINNRNRSFSCISEDELEVDVVKPPLGMGATMETDVEEDSIEIPSPKTKRSEEGIEVQQEEKLVDRLRRLANANPRFADLILTASEIADEAEAEVYSAQEETRARDTQHTLRVVNHDRVSHKFLNKKTFKWPPLPRKRLFGR